MKSSILTLTILLIASAAVYGQEGISTIAPAATDSSKKIPAKTDNDLVVAKPTVPAAQNGYVRPDSKIRFKRYVNGIVGPMALGKNIALAGFSTWRNSPEEWGDRWEGFGRRVASNFGKNFIKQTTIYGLDESLSLDSHYYRSEKKGFGSKIKNAVISPVTARTKSGRRVLGVPRIAGTYASSIIAAEAWYPARYDWKDGLKSGTFSLGFNAAFNLVKEFVWKK